MSSLRGRLVVVPGEDALTREALAEVRDHERRALERAGEFHVALAGGSTPRPLYEALAASDAELARWHVWWGDERMVPHDDPASNYRMAREALLARAELAPERVHRVRTEIGPPDAVAADYERELRAVLPRGDDTPRLDLALLGMGADGHTASLFPGSDALDERERLVAAPFVAKLDAHRVTLTLPMLAGARAVLFLVAGADKAEALRRVRTEAPSRERPASLVAPRSGELLWIADRAAAARLDA